MPDSERIPVGGNGRFRTLQGDGTKHVVEEVAEAGDALQVQRDMLTELRAIRRGLELALELDLIELASA